MDREILHADIGDLLPNESLIKFISNMKRFDSKFCELINSGREFSLRFEVKGDNGAIVHCRVGEDSWDKK